MIDTLKQTLDELRGKRVKYYTILNFTLDNARSNEILNIAGAYIYILTLDGTAKLRLNEISSDEIDLFKYRQIVSPFYRIFLTHTAQAGKTLSIAIGVGSEVFSLQDFQSPDLSLMSGYLLDLKNSAVYDYGDQISKSNVANASLVIVHTVTAGKTFLLEFFTIGVSGSMGTARLFIRDILDVLVVVLVNASLVSSGLLSGHFLLSIPEGYDVCLEASAASISAYVKGREV